MFNTLVLAFAAFSAASPALSAYIERPVAFNERDFPVSHLSARGENGTSPSINGSYIVSLIESRVGKQLGGTNNNSTGDLDEGGWPLNCSDQCASFKAFVKDKGLCQVYSIDTNDSSQMTCSGTFKIRASDFCTVSLRLLKLEPLLIARTWTRPRLAIIALCPNPAFRVR